MGTDGERVDEDLQRYGRWAAGGGALATAIWLWVQLDLLDGRVFGNFYDIQARALLDGHLDVPAGALGNEAFVVRGQEWLYNPPGPSLLRLPLFLVTDRFDGRLTVASMFLAWLATVVLVALLVWRVRRLLRPGAGLPQWEAAALAGFLVVATAGSTLLYLGAVPWVFHEAYAWAIVGAVGATHCLIGVIERPSTGRIVATGGFTLVAVLSRTPAGFACAIAVLATAGWRWWEARAETGRLPSWRGPWTTIALAGLVPVAVGVAVNWAKFRHPYLFPIEDQVFTGLSERRREAIEANGGDLFGLDLIWSTTAAYFRPDGIRLTSLFPFVSLPAEPSPAYGGAFFDLTYRTGSIVSFMPGLVGLAAWGAYVVARPRGQRAATLLRLPLMGLALIPVGIMFGAYISHRYTSEFVPFLIVAGAVGLVDVGRRLGGVGRDRRELALTGLGLLALWGVLAHVALAVQVQALANPGEALNRHLDHQEQWSALVGGDLDDLVVASVELPAEGPADEVRIIGECQAVYVGTGEEFTPWSEAGVRPYAAQVAVTDAGPPGAGAAVTLAEISGHRRTAVVLERDDRGQIRLALVGGGRDEVTDWRPAPAGTVTRVAIGTERSDHYELSLDDDVVLRVPKESHDEDWYWQPNVLAPVPVTEAQVAPLGVQVVIEETAGPAGCDERLARYRERAEGS